MTSMRSQSAAICFTACSAVLCGRSRCRRSGELVGRLSAHEGAGLSPWSRRPRAWSARATHPVGVADRDAVDVVGAVDGFDVLGGLTSGADGDLLRPRGRSGGCRSPFMGEAHGFSVYPGDQGARGWMVRRSRAWVLRGPCEGRRGLERPIPCPSGKVSSESLADEDRTAAAGRPGRHAAGGRPPSRTQRPGIAVEVEILPRRPPTASHPRGAATGGGEEHTFAGVSHVTHGAGRPHDDPELCGTGRLAVRAATPPDARPNNGRRSPAQGKRGDAMTTCPSAPPTPWPSSPGRCACSR